MSPTALPRIPHMDKQARMALDMRPVHSPDNHVSVLKMYGNAAMTLRTITAKLTLIFGGRRVTLNETVEILTSQLDDSTLDKMARSYAQSHGIELPAGRS
jgi:hypothetical protein